MAEPRFNPSHTVEFDFARGVVALGGGAPRLLVPADLLRDLLAASPEAARRDLGHRLGTELGRRVAERLGAAMADASIEGVVEHLGGELALVGLGSLAVERWGRALLLTIAGSPLGDAGDALLAWVVEGSLQRLFGRDARAVFLARAEGTVRFVVLNPGSAARLLGWLGDGVPWADAIGRLQATTAPGGSP